MSKATDSRRTRTVERVGMDEIAAMPALLDTEQVAGILGTTVLHASKLCRDGELPAVRCGRAWRINKHKFLQQVGLA